MQISIKLSSYQKRSTNVGRSAECKLVKQEELGDHIMFVGEVVEISADENIRPLLYHNGKYWRLGEALIKPQPDILIRIEELAKMHSRIQ